MDLEPYNTNNVYKIQGSSMRIIFFSFVKLSFVNCENKWMTSFLALANFEVERFPSKLVFGEATQVFHGALMDFYL